VPKTELLARLDKVKVALAKKVKEAEKALADTLTAKLMAFEPAASIIVVCVNAAGAESAPKLCSKLAQDVSKKRSASVMLLAAKDDKQMCAAVIVADGHKAAGLTANGWLQALNAKVPTQGGGDENRASATGAVEQLDALQAAAVQAAQQLAKGLTVKAGKV